jgi:hypothetical protein
VIPKPCGENDKGPTIASAKAPTSIAFLIPISDFVAGYAGGVNAVAWNRKQDARSIKALIRYCWGMGTIKP